MSGIVKCKKCGLQGKNDAGELRMYGRIWKCYRCGLEQVYESVVKRKSRKIAAEGILKGGPGT